ncbi:hypothetical protein BDW72DRAFT_173182 [Aspergillus terricola var. indicus]
MNRPGSSVSIVPFISLSCGLGLGHLLRVSGAFVLLRAGLSVLFRGFLREGRLCPISLPQLQNLSQIVSPPAADTLRTVSLCHAAGLYLGIRSVTTTYINASLSFRFPS